MPRAQSDDRTSSGSSPISSRPSEVMTKTELMLRSHAGPLSDRDLAKASQADLASGPRLEVPRRGHPGGNESLAAPREATTRGMSYRAGPQCATCIEVPPTECCRRDRESKLLTSEAARTGWGGQVASCRTTSPPSWPAPPRGRACRTYTGDRGAILNPISERARDGRTPSRGRAKPTGLQHRPRAAFAYTISSAAAIDAATMAPTSTGRASYRWRTAARQICAAAVRAAIVGP